MTAPKKRTTKSRRDKRRQHIFLKEPHLVECSNCGKSILPHRVCSYCGYYKGRQVLKISEDEEEKKKGAKGKKKDKMLDLKNLSK